MSYQVLARKWRPRNFKEMAGQTHVLKTLVSALDNDRLHHAYLFTGTRGVGKTTIARILAKCLNCETGITSAPCGQCGVCREIDEGRFIDLIEVDAASRTKVEDTRELLDNVQYAPSRGRFKVYLIDEVHMLSTHSFNALLKTLEEPPPHVKFLLATTDPQKLPVTVLSRCLQFNLKNLTPEQLVRHMSQILSQESISFEEPALWQIAKAGQGSVRDSLTLLDQAIAFCDGHVTDLEVRSLLGNIDLSVVQRLVDALAMADARGVLAVIADAAEHAPDFQTVLEELLSYLHRLAIAQVVPDGIDNSQGDRQQVMTHAAAFSAEALQLHYQIALKGRADLPLSVDPRSGLEMTLLRMLAFSPDIPNQPALDASPLREDAAAKKSDATPAALMPPMAAGRESVSLPVTPPAATMLSDSPASGRELPQARASTTPEMFPASTLSIDHLRPEDWPMLFESLSLAGITRNIAANAELSKIEADCIWLRLEPGQAQVYNEEHKRRIHQALTEYLEKDISLMVEIGECLGETPAARRKRLEQEKQALAIKTFEEDANVKEILQRFGATIQPGSIEPV
jgi:DNA polymerase III subunit gamma/tau